MPFLNLEQGSADWIAERRGKVTGSKFKDARDRTSGLTQQQTTYVALMRAGKPQSDAMAIAGYKRAPTTESVSKAIEHGVQMEWGSKAIAYAKDLARERCGGQSLSKYQSPAMRTGTEQEPFARTRYEGRTGYMVEEVGFYVADDGRFGLSPDGLIDEDGVLEVKTLASSDTLFQAFVDGDISEYMDQCLGYLWLLGRQWVDLVIWIPDLDQMAIRRIHRDEDAIEALEADLVAFAALVDEQEKKLRAALAANDQQAKQAA